MHMYEYCSASEVYMTSCVLCFLAGWVLQALALEGGHFDGAGCYNVRGERGGVRDRETDILVAPGSLTSRLYEHLEGGRVVMTNEHHKYMTSMNYSFRAVDS